jgi:hypothetical protein
VRQQPCQFFNQNCSGTIHLSLGFAAQKPIPGDNAGDWMGLAKIEARIGISFTLKLRGFFRLHHFEQDSCEVAFCRNRTGIAFARTADAQLKQRQPRILDRVRAMSSPTCRA